MFDCAALLRDRRVLLLRSAKTIETMRRGEGGVRTSESFLNDIINSAPFEKCRAETSTLRVYWGARRNSPRARELILKCPRLYSPRYKYGIPFRGGISQDTASMELFKAYFIQTLS